MRLKPGRADVLLLRWHLGTEDLVDVSRDGPAVVVRWQDAEIRLEADVFF